jgi:hypothetical protein
MRTLAMLALGALALGCGGRNLGAGGADGTVGVDAQHPVDAQVADPCAPMDVTEALTACDDPAPVRGWSWDGSCCVPIHCVCVGPDCDRLHATESECASAHVPGCIAPTPCEGQDYGECETQPGCALVFYGGGCFNEADCTPGGDPDNWMCVEQAVACVPTDQPCNARERWDCDGDCFWVQHDFELCFDQCCIDEGYGYCTGLPSCDCAPQQVEGCPDPCASVAGFFWDGGSCRPILCCCEGPDCAQTYDTAEECWAARATCPTSACGQARGYCQVGDAAPPGCDEGFGTDWRWNEAHPGVCGMGVCCTPCPDDTTPGVWYASHDPAECADLDIDCFPQPALLFDNECGCGCVTTE